jgi:dihydrofolate reductase
MKIILINASSIDGKITKGIKNDMYEWSSPEDFANFKKVRSQNNLIVMGSGTFDSIKDNERVELKPEKERLRIILTKKPKNYSKDYIPREMEFSDESPKELIKRLEKAGYKQMLLVSGNKVATSFFKENLIDELWLTIEPRIFGIGEPLIQAEEFDIKLRLLEIKKLNPHGSLFLRYKIIK